MSIKYRAIDGTTTIELWFFGRTDENILPDHLKVRSGKTFKYYEYIGEPLETTVFWQKKADFVHQFESKCLTFFSNVQKEWRKFQAQIKAITIKMNMGAVSRSTSFSQLNFISIHSPNLLPDFDFQTTFTEFDSTNEINIRYSEHRIQRLGNGFDTDCHSYESDNSFGYYRMRTDCLNDCYYNKTREICKVDRGLFRSNTLIRKEYLMNGNERLLSCYDPEYKHESFSLKQDCEEICKFECNDKYYYIEIKTRPDLTNSGIYFSHNQYPDIFVHYIPEINFIGFLCNFGGLLGMWLGLSLFGSFNDIFSLIDKIAYRKHIIKVNQIKVNNRVRTINNFVNRPLSNRLGNT